MMKVPVPALNELWVGEATRAQTEEFLAVRLCMLGMVEEMRVPLDRGHMILLTHKGTYILPADTSTLNSAWKIV